MRNAFRVLCALAGLGLAAAGCGNGSGKAPYSHNDLQLITSYSAKEMCSCRFVLEQSEEYCRGWTKQSPAVAVTRVDEARKTVESSALMLWSARARFVDEKFGCVLE